MAKAKAEKPRAGKPKAAGAKPAEPSSIYLIFGEDGYLVEQGLRRVLGVIRSRIAAGAAAPGGDLLSGGGLLAGATGGPGGAGEELEVDSVDCKEAGIAGMVAEMATPSLFSTSKATVLRNFRLDGKSKIAEELGQFLSGGVPPGQFVILLPDKVDKRLKVVKSIAKQGEMIEFARLSDDGLRAWVIERFTEEGKAASRDVAEALIDLKGYDLRTLDSEIAKAATYVGESPKVTPRDIEVLVGRSRTEQAFELISSVLAQNVGEALEILKDLLDTNQSPISMIYRLSSAARGLVIMKLFCEEESVKWSPNSSFGQFRAAVLPKYTEWVEAKGIDKGDALLRANPYFTYSRFKEGAGLKLEALIDLMDRLLEANAQLVSTSVNATVVLERVIAGVGR